jgi:membrane-bound ClpP family serine protease
MWIMEMLIGAGPVLGNLFGITWTPMAFYITVGIVHTIAILVSFRMLQADPEQNTFIAALLAAGLANVIAFFLRDMGVFGILGSSAALFGLLAVISHADMMKSIVVWIILMALYWAVAWFILPRQNDLYIEDIGGVAQVIWQGGLEAEPITPDDVDNLSKGKRDKR